VNGAHAWGAATGAAALVGAAVKFLCRNGKSACPCFAYRFFADDQHFSEPTELCSCLQQVQYDRQLQFVSRPGP
jgi:hypothetical protein